MKTPVLVVALLGLLLSATELQAAGTLTPATALEQPIQITDHRVNVVINNGFAQTEVIQTFHNPNDSDVEAIYSFPLPRSASLSEVTIRIGEREINGEVLEKERARTIYREEQKQDKDAGLATKNGYQTFEFAISRIRAGGDARIRFLYYQPIGIDSAVGRYVYPLEEGNTDEAGAAFWTRNSKVEGTLAVNVELKSAWPVVDVRVPGLENEAKVDRLAPGHYRVAVERQGLELNRDFVLYYRLEDGLPGRVELIPYRAFRDRPGTFLLLLTPGVDLKPLTSGADYVFVLDISGSMAGPKLAIQSRGVGRALAQLKPADRFRIVTFATGATEVTEGWTSATSQNVAAAAKAVDALKAGGSTNLFAGVTLALKGLDNDRATSVLLLTDGVTNTGVVDPSAFEKLVREYDVRFFGFLIGNNSNWPLVRLIAESSGGFYATASTADDIIGQLLLAKSKITSEALHGATLKISGVNVFDGTEGAIGKIYRGQQLALFGRYEKGGSATVTLKATLTGEDKTYTTTVRLPDVDTANPELERLWALNRIEAVEMMKLAGRMPAREADQQVRDLGLSYQLVTDQTAMVVMTDESFAERGIERRNRARIALERQAQSARGAQPAGNYRADQAQPMFSQPAPSLGSGTQGAGAFDPALAALATALAAYALAGRRISGHRSRP
ncbi:MAG TPA: VIT domain-containing protein [Methylomirabilota bacterium]|nr:VIT domain-containing protein [Methylomirabilota bacterium]